MKSDSPPDNKLIEVLDHMIKYIIRTIIDQSQGIDKQELVQANWTHKMLRLCSELQNACTQEQENMSQIVQELYLESLRKFKPLVHCLLQWVKIRSNAPIKEK